MSRLFRAPDFLLLAISGNGLAGTILGALGAHALKGRLETAKMTGAWQTATLYQFIHVACSLALVAWIAARPEKAKRLRWVVLWWQTGCLLFSGSIYALALGGPRLLGPITPLGGLAFMVGWGLLLAESLRRPSHPPAA